MEQINCPNCPSFLAKYEENGKESGIIELKCTKCKAIVKYDLENKTVIDIKRKITTK